MTNLPTGWTVDGDGLTATKSKQVTITDLNLQTLALNQTGPENTGVTRTVALGDGSVAIDYYTFTDTTPPAPSAVAVEGAWALPATDQRGVDRTHQRQGLAAELRADDLARVSPDRLPVEERGDDGGAGRDDALIGSGGIAHRNDFGLEPGAVRLRWEVDTGDRVVAGQVAAQLRRRKIARLAALPDPVSRSTASGRLRPAGANRGGNDGKSREQECTDVSVHLFLRWRASLGEEPI